MRRKAVPGVKEYKKFDFLTEVDSERLKLIGAITLAWNWIEGALDTALCMAADIRGDLWLDFTSRINGIDGKTAMLKKALTLPWQPELTDISILAIKDTIGNVESVKKLRVGVIHARVVHPDAMVSATAQRKGLQDEVLISEEALWGLYARLATIGLEMDWVVQALLMRSLIGRADTPDDTKTQCAESLRFCLAQLHDCQKTRAKIPPLPQFPASPPIPQGPEAL